MSRYDAKFFMALGLLAAVTIIVYLPVVNHEFVHYDDDVYVTENHNVQSPINWQKIQWAFTTGYASNWHPVTWLSHMADCMLFGLKPAGHHIVNLLLHVLNSVILFLLINKIAKAFYPALVIALLFAMHPLHVESVAWAAERKDVLSGLFGLVTLLLYCKYVIERRKFWYFLALGAFAIGLMAKPMLVTLPLLFMLLDYWPLERWEMGNGVKADAKTVAKSVIEKGPFFVLIVASSLVTFYVQQTGGAVSSIESVGLLLRIENAAIAYVSYIAKMFVPIKLAVFYPHPGSVNVAKAMLAMALLAAVTIACFKFGKKKKYLLVGWLWYQIVLVPVIGLVQIGAQSMADRYSYLSLIGLFIVIVFAIADLVKTKSKSVKITTGAITVVVLVLLSLGTTVQLSYWQNSFTLFQRALDVTENNYVMHNNVANVLSRQNKYQEAASHLQKSLKIKPELASAYTNLGNNLVKIGRFDEAIKFHKKAVLLENDNAAAHYNLAVALTKKQLNYDAIKAYEKAIELGFIKKVDAFNNLGGQYAIIGQYQKAVQCYKKALAIEPDSVTAYGNMAMALAKLGQIQQAIDYCKKVLDVRTNDYEMYSNVGFLLKSIGQKEQAKDYFKKALEIEPDHEPARQGLEALR